MAVPVPGMGHYVWLNLFLSAADGKRPSNHLFFWTFHYFMVKSLFGTQDLFMSSLMGNLQVLLTRLALVIKTRLFLKPSNVDKNKLAAFCLGSGKSTALLSAFRNGFSAFRLGKSTALLSAPMLN